MARTFEEIRQMILDQVSSYPHLAGLSLSADAEWVMWVDIVAKVFTEREELWEDYQIVLNAIADAAIPPTLPWYQRIALEYQHEAIPPTLPWYQRIALEYQHGYVFTWDPDLLRYEYPTKVESARTIQVKIAHLVNGLPEQVDPAVQTGFLTY